MRSIALFTLVLASAYPVVSQQPTASAPAPAVKNQQNAAPTQEIPPELKLLHVKRIYVDSFGDDPISKQIQSFLIADLEETNRFTVTENKEKADAIMRGAGLEKTSQEFHSHSEGTAVAGAAGAHSGSLNGSWANGSGSISGSSSGGFAAHSAAINDSNASTETVNDARMAVRLVDADGDVIWAASEESNNSKYKSATADVAERLVHKLLKKIDQLQSQPSTK